MSNTSPSRTPSPGCESLSAELAQGIDEYLVALRVEKGLARNTIEAYERDLRQYAEWLGSSDPDQSLVEEYIASMRAQGLANSTVGRKIASIKGLHRFMSLEGLEDSNPTVLIDAPRKPDPFPKALTVDQAIRLVEAPGFATPSDRRDSAILEFLYGSGARVSEAVGLDLTELDLEDKVVLVTGKGSKQRLVPLGDKAVQAIRTMKCPCMA